LSLMIKACKFMILIETANFRTFDDYLKALSRKAKKQWAYVKKHNQDLDYKEIGFDRDRVDSFMKLWQKQLVRGKPIEWAYGVGYVSQLSDEGKLKIFDAGVAMHFVFVYGNYVDCQPPMYDKQYAERYLAKFMWFNLVKWAIENRTGWILDLGGGIDDWREMIKNRSRYPNPLYKWVYVPEEVKDNPDSQKSYILKNKCLLLKE